eukprot:PhM_4_TR3503/c0_g1_i1/m.5921
MLCRCRFVFFAVPPPKSSIHASAAAFAARNTSQPPTPPHKQYNQRPQLQRKHKKEEAGEEDTPTTLSEHFLRLKPFLALKARHRAKEFRDDDEEEAQQVGSLDRELAVVFPALVSTVVELVQLARDGKHNAICSRAVTTCCSLYAYFDIAELETLERLFELLADRNVVTRLDATQLSICMDFLRRMGAAHDGSYQTLKTRCLESAVYLEMDLQSLSTVLHAISMFEAPHSGDSPATDQLKPLFNRAMALLRKVRYPHKVVLTNLSVAMRCAHYNNESLMMLVHNSTMDVYNRFGRKRIGINDLHVIVRAMVAIGGPTQELQKALYALAVKSDGVVLFEETH